MDATPPPNGRSAPASSEAAGAPAPPHDAHDAHAPRPKLVRFADVLEAFRADAEDAFNARVNGVSRGPVTGLRSVDDALGGVMQPGVHVLQAGSGVGKTAWGLQSAAECGAPALFVSCEMHLVELLRRHTARVTGTYLDRLKSGEFAPDDAVRLARRAAAAAPQLALVDGTQAHVSPDLLYDFALATRGTARHVYVVIDSVHSWVEKAPAGLTEYEALNAGLAALRTLASRLNCPILGIAERNRASMAAGGLSSSAGSRKFEYGAESVLGLSVDEGKDAPMLTPPQKPIKITIEKNRNGACGMTLKAVFNGALQQFSDRER
jgi:replicative DNA helicase